MDSEEPGAMNSRPTNRRRPGIGNQMLKFPRKAGSPHVLRRQQRQHSEE